MKGPDFNTDGKVDENDLLFLTERLPTLSQLELKNLKIDILSNKTTEGYLELLSIMKESQNEKILRIKEIIYSPYLINLETGREQLPGLSSLGILERNPDLKHTLSIIILNKVFIESYEYEILFEVLARLEDFTTNQDYINYYLIAINDMFSGTYGLDNVEKNILEDFHIFLYNSDSSSEILFDFNAQNNLFIGPECGDISYEDIIGFDGNNLSFPDNLDERQLSIKDNFYLGMKEIFSIEKQLKDLEAGKKYQTTYYTNIRFIIKLEKLRFYRETLMRIEDENLTYSSDVTNVYGSAYGIYALLRGNVINNSSIPHINSLIEDKDSFLSRVGEFNNHWLGVSGSLQRLGINIYATETDTYNFSDKLFLDKLSFFDDFDFDNFTDAELESELQTFNSIFHFNTNDIQLYDFRVSYNKRIEALNIAGKVISDIKKNGLKKGFQNYIRFYSILDKNIKTAGMEDEYDFLWSELLKDENAAIGKYLVEHNLLKKVPYVYFSNDLGNPEVLESMLGNIKPESLYNRIISKIGDQEYEVDFGTVRSINNNFGNTLSFREGNSYEIREETKGKYVFVYPKAEKGKIPQELLYDMLLSIGAIRDKDNIPDSISSSINKALSDPNHNNLYNYLLLESSNSLKLALGDDNLIDGGRVIIKKDSNTSDIMEDIKGLDGFSELNIAYSHIEDSIDFILSTEKVNADSDVGIVLDKNVYRSGNNYYMRNSPTLVDDTFDALIKFSKELPVRDKITLYWNSLKYLYFEDYNMNVGAKITNFQENPLLKDLLQTDNILEISKYFEEYDFKKGGYLEYIEAANGWVNLSRYDLNTQKIPIDILLEKSKDLSFTQTNVGDVLKMLGFLKSIPGTYYGDFFERIMKNTKERLSLNFNRALKLKPSVENLHEYTNILMQLYELEKNLVSNVAGSDDKSFFNKDSNNPIFEGIHRNLSRHISVYGEGITTDGIAQLESVDRSTLAIEIFDVLKEEMLVMLNTIIEKEEFREYMLEGLSSIDRIYLYEIGKIYNIDLSKELNLSSGILDDIKDTWSLIESEGLFNSVPILLDKFWMKVNDDDTEDGYREEIFEKNIEAVASGEIAEGIPKYGVEIDGKEYGHYYELDLKGKGLKAKVVGVDLAHDEPITHENLREEHDTIIETLGVFSDNTDLRPAYFFGIKNSRGPEIINSYMGRKDGILLVSEDFSKIDILHRNDVKRKDVLIRFKEGKIDNFAQAQLILHNSGFEHNGKKIISASNPYKRQKRIIGTKQGKTIVLRISEHVTMYEAAMICKKLGFDSALNMDIIVDAFEYYKDSDGKMKTHGTPGGINKVSRFIVYK